MTVFITLPIYTDRRGNSLRQEEVWRLYDLQLSSDGWVCASEAYNAIFRDSCHSVNKMK